MTIRTCRASRGIRLWRPTTRSRRLGSTGARPSNSTAMRPMRRPAGAAPQIMGFHWERARFPQRRGLRRQHDQQRRRRPDGRLREVHRGGPGAAREPSGRRVGRCRAALQRWRAGRSVRGQAAGRGRAVRRSGRAGRPRACCARATRGPTWRRCRTRSVSIRMVGLEKRPMPPSGCSKPTRASWSTASVGAMSRRALGI